MDRWPDFSGGTLTNSGRSHHQQQPSDKALSGATIDNTGSVFHLNGRLLLSNGTIINESSGLYDFQGDTTSIISDGGTNALTNSGTIHKSSGSRNVADRFQHNQHRDDRKSTPAPLVSPTASPKHPPPRSMFGCSTRDPGTLDVGGAFALAGSLNILSPTGYIPPQGNTYNVVTYGSQTGAFAAINGLTGPEPRSRSASGQPPCR